MELATIVTSTLVSLIVVFLNNHFNTKNILLRNDNMLELEKLKFENENLQINQKIYLSKAEKLHKILSKIQRFNSPSSSYQVFYKYTLEQLDEEYSVFNIEIDEARMLIELYFNDFLENMEKINTNSELFYDQKRQSVLSKQEHDKIINQDQYYKEISSLSQETYKLARSIKINLHKKIQPYNKSQK